MLLIMHYSVSTHWDVYKTLVRMTIWDVLTFDCQIITNIHYMLLTMQFSVSTHLDVYKTLEKTIWDVLKFDNILSNTITNIHYMLLIM